MSTEAVKWAMDDAPMLRTDKGKPDTTSRHVLQALAEHAHKDGSNARPSVLRIQYRTGYDRRTVQRALRRLESEKLIAAKGVVNGCTSYTLDLAQRRPASDWQALEAEEEAERAAAAERKRRSRAKAVTHSASATVTHSDDVTQPDVTHSDDGRHALEVRDVTHSASGRHALNAARTNKEPPEEPPGTKDSSSAPPAQDEDDDLFGPLEAASKAAHNGSAPEDLKAFGDFWLLYPKSRDKPATLTAWRSAIADGVSPQKITAAAMAYAQERKGQDHKFTKYSANWLRDGRYDDLIDPDQPPPPSHATEWRPFRNPENHDVYEEPLI